MKKVLAVMLTALMFLTSCSNEGGTGLNTDNVQKNYDHDQGTVHMGSTAVFTDDTIYFTSNGMIKYADKSSGIGGPLCGKPECTHKDSACTAYISLQGSPELSNYDGALYWWESDTMLEPHVYKVNYDGTGRELVRDLVDVTMFTGTPNYSFVHRGYMFFSYQTWGSIDGKTKAGVHILAYDLNSDEEGITVYGKDYDDTVSQPIIQAYENYLYIMLPISEWQWQSEARMSMEKRDPALEMYRWNIETHELETLYNGGVPFSAGEFHITDDGILICGRITDDSDSNFQADGHIYHYDFESKEISQYLELNGEAFGDTKIVNGLFVGVFGDIDKLMISIVDFSGQVILDKTYSLNFLNENNQLTYTLYGTDEDNLYYHIGGLHDRDDEFLVAFPLDGGDPKVLYSRKGDG